MATPAKGIDGYTARSPGGGFLCHAYAETNRFLDVCAGANRGGDVDRWEQGRGGPPDWQQLGGVGSVRAAFNDVTVALKKFATSALHDCLQNRLVV